MSGTLAIRELGDDLGVNSADPSFDEDARLSRWNGETIDWRCKFRVEGFDGSSGTLRRQWKLPDYSEVEITERRLVHSCSKFEKRSNWFGTGVVGVTFALTAGVVSAARAANHRRGKVAAGQVLYDWPVNVIQSQWNESRSVYTQLGISWFEGDAPLRLEVAVGLGGATQLAEYLVSLIARYRLSHPDLDLDKAGRELLSTQATEPVAESLNRGLCYQLPGSLRAPNVLTT